MSHYQHPLNLYLKKGSLHRSLHIPQGQKIGEDRLRKVLSSSGSSTLEKKRAQFAENARHWHHKGQSG